MVDLLVAFAREMGPDEPKRALQISARALDLAERISYEKGVAYGKLAVGSAQAMLSDNDNALAVLSESLTLFESMDEPEAHGQNLAAIAQVQLSMGEYAQALGNAFAALKLFEQVGNELRQAWIINGIAMGYRELGDYEPALEYPNRSLKMFRQLEEQVGEARSLSGIGTIYQTLGDYEEAVEYHFRSLEIFEKTGNRIGEARALNDVGTIYQRVEEFDKAREFHVKSLEIRRKLGSRQAESTSLLNLGNLAIDEGNAAEAIEILAQALEIAREVKAKPRVYQCHQALSRAYEMDGDLGNALKHHQEFHRIKEELTGEEAASRVKNLQVGFAVEKSEREAEIAQLKNVELREKNEQLEHLLAELKAAEAQLIQAEKMAALGGIVGGIVHELNTPLGVIGSATDMLSKCTADIQTALDNGSSAEDIRSDATLRAALETLEENKRLTELATERIGKIVATLKSFARLDRAVFEQVDLHDGIETTLTLLENRLQRIEVVRDYGTLPLVPCYASEMNQLFLNLLMNAVQAIRGNGTITIRTHAEESRVRLDFSDTGVGIPEDQISHLFEPTFTKKGSRVKASLGLVAGYNIVQKHNGQISVESELGSGTTFTVSLPVNLQMWPQIT